MSTPSPYILTVIFTAGITLTLNSIQSLFPLFLHSSSLLGALIRSVIFIAVIFSLNLNSSIPYLLIDRMPSSLTRNPLRPQSFYTSGYLYGV